MTIPEIIRNVAQAQGVNENLALAVARRESGFRQDARGAAGDVGVFQLMPATATQLGVDAYDLADNIRGGIVYLREQLTRFGGDAAQALAAYNWGPERVAHSVSQWASSWFDHIPASTQAYVRGVLDYTGESGELPTYRVEVLGIPLMPNWVWVILGMLVLLLVEDS